MRNDRAIPRHVVAALVGPGAYLFELGIICEVFGIDRSDLGVNWYQLSVCGTDAGAVRTGAAFDLVVPHGLEALRLADTVVVLPCDPAFERNPDERAVEALRRAHSRGARILSICSGAFLVAAAGLLDGRRATTHWLRAEELAERYPKIEVDPSVLYIDEGDVMSSAGTTSGVDLCLHVVRVDYGAEIANAVARRMVAPPHRTGGQAQFAETPLPRQSRPELLTGTLDWMKEHLSQPITIGEVARQAAMSKRSFIRVFHAVTGTTPHRWLIHQRVLAAQRMLETTDGPIDRVAQACGFGTAANLRKHFRALVKTSPATYRRTFRANA